MKKILVPTDFSSFANSALNIAITTAQKFQAELVLFHVMLTPNNITIESSEESTYIGGTSNPEAFEQTLKSRQESLREKVANLGYDKASYQIRSGNITQQIIEYTEKNQVDMIIMGTQGDSDYDTLFVGSNAEKVVQLAECPVITSRKIEGEVDFKNIVFACNLEVSHRLPLDQIKQIQSLFDAKVHLTYINTPAYFQTTYDLHEKATHFIQEYQLSNCAFDIYCDLVEDDGINNFAESVNADLIIVVSNKRRGFSRLLAGSVSAGVVNVSNIPVLTFAMQKK